MTKADFHKKVKDSAANLEGWILSKWSNLDEFHKDVVAGDILTIPCNAVVPASYNEYADAKKNNTRTSDIIELTRNNIYNINGTIPELIIFDGHNRMMDLDQNSTVRVKIVD